MTDSTTRESIDSDVQTDGGTWKFVSGFYLYLLYYWYWYWYDVAILWL